MCLKSLVINVTIVSSVGSGLMRRSIVTPSTRYSARLSLPPLRHCSDVRLCMTSRSVSLFQYLLIKTSSKSFQLLTSFLSEVHQQLPWPSKPCRWFLWWPTLHRIQRRRITNSLIRRVFRVSYLLIFGCTPSGCLTFNCRMACCYLGQRSDVAWIG